MAQRAQKTETAAFAIAVACSAGYALCSVFLCGVTIFDPTVLKWAEAISNKPQNTILKGIVKVIVMFMFLLVFGICHFILVDSRNKLTIHKKVIMTKVIKFGHLNRFQIHDFHQQSKKLQSDTPKLKFS